MLKTREFHFEKEPGEEVVLVISQATSLMGMRRTVLASKGYEANAGDPAAGIEPETDDAVRFMRTSLYPMLVAPVASAHGLAWPISFTDFCQLPDAVTASWEAVVFDLNPHWNPAGITPEATAEKKDGSSKSVSTPTSESPEMTTSQPTS
jgi:hypothetical protein